MHVRQSLCALSCAECAVALDTSASTASRPVPQLLQAREMRRWVRRFAPMLEQHPGSKSVDLPSGSLRSTPSWHLRAGEGPLTMLLHRRCMPGCI